MEKRIPPNSVEIPRNLVEKIPPSLPSQWTDGKRERENPLFSLPARSRARAWRFFPWNGTPPSFRHGFPLQKQKPRPSKNGRGRGGDGIVTRSRSARLSESMGFIQLLARRMLRLVFIERTKRTLLPARIRRDGGLFGLRLLAYSQPRILRGVPLGSQARCRADRFAACVQSTFPAPRFPASGLCDRATAATTPRASGRSSSHSQFVPALRRHACGGSSLRRGCPSPIPPLGTLALRRPVRCGLFRLGRLLHQPGFRRSTPMALWSVRRLGTARF